LLAGYYGSAPSALAQYRFNRVACFAEFLGVPRPVSPRYMRAKYESDVDDFAVLYVLAQSGGSTVAHDASRQLITRYTREALELFSAWLNAQ
jgi:hypothetical protein